MQVKHAAERVGYGAGAASIVLVTSVLASAVTGLQHDRDHYRAQAARPAPTVTVTASPAPAASNRRPRPSLSRTAPQAAVTVVAAGEPSRTAGGAADGRAGAAGDGTSGGGGPSGGSSTPPPAPSCEGALSVRLPLGVLPHCALTVGGSR